MKDYISKMCLPIAFATAGLLHRLGISIGVTRLAEVAREMLVGFGSAVGETDMITIVVFVGTGHW